MRLLASLMCSLCLYAAGPDHPVPRFTDPERRSKLAKAFDDVDRIFERFAKNRHIPGMVWGIVIDAELAHVKAVGIQEQASRAPVTPATVFRIASMTKSFTALAILKLRDEGKLSLEDPVSKWIPEFGQMERPLDTPPIRVRQLLTHSAGFPEDNPWGDRQLGIPEDQLTAWLKQGIPFSTPPGSAYEYSNYGFALLGRIVSKASGMPYGTYLQQQILAPLGMKASTLEPSGVPAAVRAVGYRRLPDGSYEEEKPLPHGAFGAMGGLLTSAVDLAKYVAFHLSAWPARSGPETGPVRRSSVREMNRMWRFHSLSASEEEGRLQAEAAGYGYGLRISRDCRIEHIAGHGGGLPGYGSYMAWLPERGVGLFAMANLTYAGPGTVFDEAWEALLATGGLQKRQLPAAPVLTQMRDAILDLWNEWSDEDAKKIAADNLFLDIPAGWRREQVEQLKREAGKCSGAGPVQPLNWLRGTFEIDCANSDVVVNFTLAPTRPPTVQHLAFAKKQEQKAAAGACAP